MLEWRFEPAGGGLRLVWRFWRCGGVPGGRERCLIGLGGLRRAPRAPRPRRERARPQLCACSCSRNELAHARIDPFFRSETANRPFDSATAFIGRGDHTRCFLFHSLGLVSPLARKTHLGGRRCRFRTAALSVFTPILRAGQERSFPANAGVRQPHLEPPRARAVLKPPQTAGKQPRLSRGFSMGPWPSRGSNGLPWPLAPCGFCCDFRNPPSESSDVST